MPNFFCLFLSFTVVGIAGWEPETLEKTTCDEMCFIFTETDTEKTLAPWLGLKHTPLHSSIGNWLMMMILLQKSLLNTTFKSMKFYSCYTLLVINIKAVNNKKSRVCFDDKAAV